MPGKRRRGIKTTPSARIINSTRSGFGTADLLQMESGKILVNLSVFVFSMWHPAMINIIWRITNTRDWKNWREKFVSNYFEIHFFLLTSRTIERHSNRVAKLARIIIINRIKRFGRFWMIPLEKWIRRSLVMKHNVTPRNFDDKSAPFAQINQMWQCCFLHHFYPWKIDLWVNALESWWSANVNQNLLKFITSFLALIVKHDLLIIEGSNLQYVTRFKAIVGGEYKSYRIRLIGLPSF